jgi:transposase, IS5 family
MLVALSSEALAKRSPGSNKAGREGIAPDRLLRCVVLKHTRFYEDPIPDFSNLCRAFALFGKQGTERIHQRIVRQAQEAAIIAGNKLRTDTTAVETNIHHPTDSSLLADSLRVMNRYLQRIAAVCHDSKLRIVNHARAAKYRVLKNGRAARTFTQAGQEQLRQSYEKLVALTQGVKVQADAVVLAKAKKGKLND